MLHSLFIALKIASLIIIGLWLSAFLVAEIRHLIHGPDVPEEINAAFIAKYTKQAQAEGYLHRVAVVFDIAVNVAFRGQEDETISGRAWRASLEGKLWGRVMNYFLDLWQFQHGPKAAVGDYQRATNRITINSKALGITQ